MSRSASTLRRLRGALAPGLRLPGDASRAMRALRRNASGAVVRLRRNASGAAAVEFALLFGLIVMVVIGTIQVGRLLQARSAVNYALSQTVRQVHLHPDITPEEIQAHLEGLLDAGSTLQVCVRPLPSTSVAEIRVVFPFELNVPFVPLPTLQVAVETLAPRIKQDVDTTDTCSQTGTMG